MIRYFIDPLLRGPTIGAMLMCLTASLMGVFLFVRKRSLLGETLSHATYPGVIGGIIFAVMFDLEKWMLLFTLLGGSLSALLGLGTLHFLKEKRKVKVDSAQVFIIALFFGVGTLLASHVQSTYSAHFRTVTAYLYGQAATMQDLHILLYGGMALVTIVLLILFYKELHVLSFDGEFAASTSNHIKAIDTLFLSLVVIATVMGMRSVGVVLMSAMLLAPAITARQYTHSMKWMLVLAAVFGLTGAFLGSYLSYELSSKKISLPTGSMIVIVTCLFTFVSLLFAPRSGLLIRYLRVLHFRYNCVEENLLKALWRNPKGEGELKKSTGLQSFWLTLLLWRLRFLRLIQKEGDHFILTESGRVRGDHIVRLHRLWEVYLVEYLGVGIERVHKNAEEMEHILTPEIERELTDLLNNPKYDPHKQPIPGALAK